MNSDDPKKGSEEQKADVRTEVSGDNSVGVGRDVENSILVARDLNIYSEKTVKNKSAESPPPRQLHGDLADFTGRDHEVKELVNTLARGGGRVAISAINGMGGVGKSVLAVHIAHKLVDRYPDGQIVVDMQGTSDRPLTALEAMAKVIQAFRPESRVSDDIQQVAQDYRNTLAGKHALILLDNAENAAQVRSLVPPPPCAVIITSRRTIFVEGVHPISLDALSERDARDLLREIVGKKRATNKQLDAVAGLCGRLPLALRVAGTFLAAHRDWPVDEYIEALTDERKRLPHLKQDELDVEATLALSARQLESEQADLAARWKRLSVFPVDFDREAAAAVWGVTTEETRRGLSDLLERSLILFDDESKRYHLHDLVRLFTDAQLSEDERIAYQQRHADHYKTLLRRANEFYLHGGEVMKSGLALFDLEWRNIQAGQAWAASYIEMNNSAAELCSEYPDAGAYILFLRQYPRDRICWLEAALSSARWLKKRSMEGNHLGNLGLAYAALGETRRAIEYHEQRIAIAREIGDRRGEGSALFNMSLALDELSDRAQAIINAEAALRIFEQIESPAADKARNVLAEWHEQK